MRFSEESRFNHGLSGRRYRYIKKGPSLRQPRLEDPARRCGFSFGVSGLRASDHDRTEARGKEYKRTEAYRVTSSGRMDVKCKSIYVYESVNSRKFVGVFGKSTCRNSRNMIKYLFVNYVSLLTQMMFRPDRSTSC